MLNYWSGAGGHRRSHRRYKPLLEAGSVVRRILPELARGMRKLAGEHLLDPAAVAAEVPARHREQANYFCKDELLLPGRRGSRHRRNGLHDYGELEENLLGGGLFSEKVAGREAVGDKGRGVV